MDQIALKKFKKCVPPQSSSIFWGDLLGCAKKPKKARQVLKSKKVAFKKSYKGAVVDPVGNGLDFPLLTILVPLV